MNRVREFLSNPPDRTGDRPAWVRWQAVFLVICLTIGTVGVVASVSVRAAPVATAASAVSEQDPQPSCYPGDPPPCVNGWKRPKTTHAAKKYYFQKKYGRVPRERSGRWENFIENVTNGNVALTSNVCAFIANNQKNLLWSPNECDRPRRDRPPQWLVDLQQRESVQDAAWICGGTGAVIRWMGGAWSAVGQGIVTCAIPFAYYEIKNQVRDNRLYQDGKITREEYRRNRGLSRHQLLKLMRRHGRVFIHGGHRV